MQNTTKKKLTMDGLLASIHVFGDRVSSGVSLTGDNNEYNPNIFKAFKPLLKPSYGPVLPVSEQGRHVIPNWRYGLT